MSSCAMAWPQHLPEPLLDASYKGYPLGAPPCAAGAVGEQGWNLLDGDLPLPLAVLDEAALAHPDYEDGVSCPACITERTPEQRAGYAERQRQEALAKARGQAHVGAVRPPKE